MHNHTSIEFAITIGNVIRRVIVTECNAGKSPVKNFDVSPLVHRQSLSKSYRLLWTHHACARTYPIGIPAVQESAFPAVIALAPEGLTASKPLTCAYALPSTPQPALSTVDRTPHLSTLDAAASISIRINR